MLPCLNTKSLLYYGQLKPAGDASRYKGYGVVLYRKTIDGVCVCVFVFAFVCVCGFTCDWPALYTCIQIPLAVTRYQSNHPISASLSPYPVRYTHVLSPSIFIVNALQIVHPALSRRSLATADSSGSDTQHDKKNGVVRSRIIFSSDHEQDRTATIGGRVGCTRINVYGVHVVFFTVFFREWVRVTLWVRAR